MAQNVVNIGHQLEPTPELSAATFSPSTVQECLFKFYNRAPIRGDLGGELFNFMCGQSQEFVNKLQDLEQMIKDLGFTSDHTYYRQITKPDEKPAQLPLLVVTATNRNDEFGFANLNQVNSGTGGREDLRHEDDPNKKHLMVSQERAYESREGLYRAPNSMEHFPNDAPAAMVLEVNRDGECALRAVLSPAAFEHACRQAARIVRSDSKDYSYVLDERVIPAVTAYLHARNPVFYGEHELPKITDFGTPADGRYIAIIVETIDANENLTRVALKILVNHDEFGDVAVKIVR